ncbi:MAG: SAM-dependent methyltransferase [Rubrivivax sp.]|jgi:16S rRNA (cytidine1402-2'-O)-methyltransferase|nr:SAM-dependent methyltransferase [Rubrivivax sp.]
MAADPGAGAPPGTLWLVPNALDHGADPVPIDDVLPLGTLRRAAALAQWVVEDARSARAFLKRAGAIVPLARPLQSIVIRELPRAPKGGSAGAGASAWRELLAPAHAGEDVGLLSEAGLPAVADPGSRLVAAAHAEGVPVRALPGPCAPVLALAASGLDGQHFSFVGYLPQEPAARIARLRELESLSARLAQTQVFIETPYRNAALLDAIVAHLDARTRLSVSCGLTLPQGWSRCDSVAGWRARPQALPPRLPAVFALLAR